MNKYVFSFILCAGLTYTTQPTPINTVTVDVPSFIHKHKAFIGITTAYIITGLIFVYLNKNYKKTTSTDAQKKEIFKSKDLSHKTALKTTNNKDVNTHKNQQYICKARATHHFDNDATTAPEGTTVVHAYMTDNFNDY